LWIPLLQACAAACRRRKVRFVPLPGEKIFMPEDGLYYA